MNCNYLNLLVIINELLRNFFQFQPKIGQMRKLLQKSILPLLFFGLLALSGINPAFGQECIVGSTNPLDSSGMATLIKKATKESACRLPSGHYRSRYALNAQKVAVIRFTKSMTIHLASLPELYADPDIPLIITADEGTTVTLIGSSQPVTIAKGGRVILDHLTFKNFPHVALKMDGDFSILMNSVIQNNGSPSSPAIYVTGRENVLINNHITQNRGNGIFISEGNSPNCATLLSNGGGHGSRLLGNRIDHNGGSGNPANNRFGVQVKAYAVQITPWEMAPGYLAMNRIKGVVLEHETPYRMANLIANNAGGGVYVESQSACGSSKPAEDLHRVWISQTGFSTNGKKNAAIFVSKEPLPSPVNLVEISGELDINYNVVGNVPFEMSSLWNQSLLNIKALEIQLFLADKAGEGAVYLASTNQIEANTGKFVITFPKKWLSSLGINGKPKFVTTLVDNEHKNTSPFSAQLNTENEDWDGDGLKNNEEDFNHDGKVDIAFGETDPRLWDTDGDGLSDGEERLMIERIKEAIDNGVVISDPTRLDPTNFDSDNDCLPDGLELGITLEDFQKDMDSSAESARLILSAACIHILNEHGVAKLDNAVLWNPSEVSSLENIRTLVDLDPSTTTDPTNRDSDEDGMIDGVEDWNFNGRIDMEEGKESDETNPHLKDSDGDGIPDGDEEDLNGNGILDAHESDPLKKDTDGDGVADNIEITMAGLFPNMCDSEGDGLNDGIEMGIIHVSGEEGGCDGLQTSGSNFENMEILNPAKVDSDGDGLADGEEDLNHNGWLDPGETDPTTPDSDGDGIGDYEEMTGDLDREGIVDINLLAISNPDCSPPSFMADLDCDGEINAVDLDSDNDGCLDSEEWKNRETTDTLPAAYSSTIKKCGASQTAASGGGAVTLPEEEEETEAVAVVPASELVFSEGGGDCSLRVSGKQMTTNYFWLFFLWLIPIFRGLHQKNRWPGH